MQGAAACLSTDQEIISVKHRLQWCSHTKTVLFRALIYCMDLNECSKPYGVFTQRHTDTLMGYLLVEIGNSSVCFIIKRIMLYLLTLVCVVCYVSAKHIASMLL